MTGINAARTAGEAMILFDLKCHTGHVFEAWFRDGATFETQKLMGEIACPICGETKVSKAPMAPRIGKSRNEPQGIGGEETKLAGALAKELERLFRHIEENADYVGDQFPEEARRIHQDEAERRDIYGEASESETRALIEEGVEIHRIPWVRRRRLS